MHVWVCVCVCVVAHRMYLKKVHHKSFENSSEKHEEQYIQCKAQQNTVQLTQGNLSSNCTQIFQFRIYVFVVKIRFANGMYQYFRTLHNLKPVYITLYNGLISINPNTLTLCSQFPKFNR